jgi:CheY-like chemotaxis protein
MADSVWIDVLEDDPVQCALYKRILGAGNFEATVIQDPVDLVGNLDNIPVPRALLLDILLPGMDGLAVMQHLQRHPLWCLVPVILMTSSPTRDRVVAANQLPVPPEGFLVKPVNPRAMLQLLRAVIAGQEPTYLLRSLQRRRLALRLGLHASIVELEAVIRQSNDRTNWEARHAEARRQIQSLRSAESQLRDAPVETRQAITDQVRALEESCANCRRQIETAENQRKILLSKRHEILLRQKSVREIEERIQALSGVVKRIHMTKPPGPAAEDAPAVPQTPEPPGANFLLISEEEHDGAEGGEDFEAGSAA